MKNIRDTIETIFPLDWERIGTAPKGQSPAERFCGLSSDLVWTAIGSDVDMVVFRQLLSNMAWPTISKKNLSEPLETIADLLLLGLNQGSAGVDNLFLRTADITSMSYDMGMSMHNDIYFSIIDSLND